MVFKLQQILDEKNNIHSVSFISSWDEPTSWSSNFTTITYHQRTWWTYFDTQWIKDTTWQRRLRLLSHGRAYIHFNESSLRELDESRSCRSCDQFVGGSQIKYIIKNEELSVGRRTIFQKNGCVVVVWSTALHRKTLHVSHKSVKELFLDE